MGNKPTTIEINGKQYDALTGKQLHVAGKSSIHSAKRPVMDIANRQSPSKSVHKTPQKSQTLMRHAVKKPAVPKVSNPTIAKAPEDIVSLQSPFGGPFFSSKFDIDRQSRAQKIKQSNLVSRFSDSALSLARPLTPRIQPLAVRPEPTMSAAVQHHNNPKTDALIAKGLKNAQSHTEVHKPKKAHRKHRKLASFAAGSLAILLLGGFFFYQNIPNMSVRYAAARSGVNASLPGYKPSGFALSSHIKYSPGQITLSFNSSTDDREFTITQRESTWNSETLRSNYVANVNTQVHNFEDKGQTIYLYGNSNATWVNGGVWYELSGESGLNSDQLIRIATSM